MLSIFPSFLQDSYTPLSLPICVSQTSTVSHRDCCLCPQCSCTKPHCMDTAPYSCIVRSDRDQFSQSSVCGHRGSGYICCLTKLCQALGEKAGLALASGNPARDLYNKEHSLSPKHVWIHWTQGAHITEKKRPTQKGHNNLLLTGLKL